MPAALCLAAGLALPAVVTAQAPTLVPATLRSVSPAGVRRGQTVNLTLDGLNISGATRAVFDDPALVGIPRPGANANQAVVRLEIPLSARAGVRSVALETPLGMTAAVTFAVGDAPEANEREPNDTPAGANPAVLPVTLAGRLDGPGDRDTFAFEARDGQEIVAEIVASRIRSRLAGRLVVTGPDGVAAAEAQGVNGQRDPLLVLQAQKSGRYAIAVYDLENAGGGDVTYRLNLSVRPHVTHAFPLGFQQGSAEIRLYGAGMGPDGTTVVVTSQAAGRGAVALVWDAPAGQLQNPVTLRVGDLPEVIENPGDNDAPDSARRVAWPVTINGRINAAEGGRGSDVDHYSFTARRGERLVLEVDARRLGSPLDSFVEVLDARGRRVQRATLRCLAETVLTLADRDSATTGLRLLSWSDFTVRDLVYIRGEVTQLTALPRGPDDDARFRALRGVRRGLLDTTPTGHAANTPIYKVTVHPPGAKFPPNGMPLIPLYYRNDDGGPLFGKDSFLTFMAPDDGEYLVRVGDVRGESGPAYSYRLTLRPPRPDFRAEVSPQHPGIPAGSAIPLDVTLDRFDGFEDEVEVALEGLPTGFTATRTIVEAGETTANLLLRAGPGAATGPAPGLRLVARGRVEGREVIHAVPLAGGACRLTVLPKPDLAVSTASSTLSLQPGEHGWIEVRITRQNGFAGRVPVELRNLPFGVRVLDVGLNGVLITESETSRRFAVVAEPWVRSLKREIYCTARTETASAASTEVAAEPIRLQVGGGAP